MQAEDLKCKKCRLSAAKGLLGRHQLPETLPSPSGLYLIASTVLMVMKMLEARLPAHTKIIKISLSLFITVTVCLKMGVLKIRLDGRDTRGTAAPHAVVSTCMVQSITQWKSTWGPSGPQKKSVQRFLILIGKVE